MFVFSSLEFRWAFTSNDYGLRVGPSSAPSGDQRLPHRPIIPTTEAAIPVIPETTPTAPARLSATRKRTTRVVAAGLVAAGALLAACSSSSTTDHDHRCAGRHAQFEQRRLHRQ